MIELIETAADWHCGGNSPLHSFLVSGGKIHSEFHRNDMISEIISCLEAADFDDLRTTQIEMGRLESLLSYVENYQLQAQASRGGQANLDEIEAASY